MNTAHGMPGRYFVVPPTLADGEPTALATNNQGVLLVELNISDVVVSNNITKLGDQTIALGAGVSTVGTLRIIPSTDSSIGRTWTLASTTDTVLAGSISAAVQVGQKTVSTSAVQVLASSVVPTNGILIRALSTNSASIFVGGSGVTTSNGYELLPGETTSFTCNINTLYIISAASITDKICYSVV